MWTEEIGIKLPANVEPVPVRAIGSNTDWSTSLEGVDTVIHLAARVHVLKDALSDPISAYREVNVFGTERLARAAADRGVKRLVFMSSVKVHGEENEEPYKESDPPNPQDPYSASKLEAELGLKRVSAETGLEIVIIRSPLVYGPGVRANFLQLLRIVDKGIPLPFLNVDNKRSMIFLGNLLDALITCAKHSSAAGEIYLVSDGDDVSTPVLIRRLAEALDRPTRLFGVPIGLTEAMAKAFGQTAAIRRLLGSLRVDARKLSHDTGWNPPFGMGKGLRQTAAWYRNQNSRDSLGKNKTKF